MGSYNTIRLPVRRSIPVTYLMLLLLLATGSGDADSELALKLNPSDRTLRYGQTLLVIASSKEHAESINDISVGDAAQDGASDCPVAPWYSATLDWEMRGNSGRAAPTGQRSYIRDAASSDLATIPAVGRGDAALALTTRPAAAEEGSPHVGGKDPDLDLMDHVIVSGCPDSFVEFVRTLRAVWGGGSGESSSCSPTLVVLHPSLDPGGRDADLMAELREVAGGAERVRVVRGSPSEASALERASASRARCARACSTDIGLFTNVLYDDMSPSQSSYFPLLLIAGALFTWPPPSAPQVAPPPRAHLLPRRRLWTTALTMVGRPGPPSWRMQRHYRPATGASPGMYWNTRLFLKWFELIALFVYSP